jgi:hypothetical protein
VEHHRAIHAAIKRLKSETGGEVNYGAAERQIHNALALGAEAVDLLPRLLRKIVSHEQHIQQLIDERETSKTSELSSSLAPGIPVEAEGVIAAARCIQHWHDREPDGMVVSAEAVRSLWQALIDYDALIASASLSVQGTAWRTDVGSYAAAQTSASAQGAASAPLEHDERERLHAIIADCNGLIDPEQHPELNARIDAVLTPCDHAGHCVSPPAPTASAKGEPT